ncbi:glycosyltransferase [Mesorhizobium sp. RP14(2022)]|uniref:Glycosyltransferase n=1 Tax=Mesorhizobium liriopis TaxID=2953882 RepID=A0ABT1C0N9_9HYPH|nr:glycosyltransferase [Mesorhizobium liriopis]MCO6048400.1 glycosyltransferase [Mesorhizobium liriopis]
MPDAAFPPHVTLFGHSAGLDASRFAAVVTLPTFRRPAQVVETLRSLAAQKTSEPFAVIVMENDAEGLAGARAAKALFEDGTVEGLVIVAHQRGNCSAYNAGWATALKQFPAMRHLLVIDDDETASAGWIEGMRDAARRLGADIVGGPQRPVFEREPRAGVRKHPVFAPPYGETRLVPALYSSGNLLIGRNVLEAMGPPFLDGRFNFLGGGDSDFLSRTAAKGFKLGWCAEAPVMEAVPARRVEGDWIRARSVRNGVISTLVEKGKRGNSLGARARVLGKSLGLLSVSPLRAFRDTWRSGSAAIGAYPVLVAIGRLAAEFGYAREQYREPEKN